MASTRGGEHLAIAIAVAAVCSGCGGGAGDEASGRSNSPDGLGGAATTLTRVPG